MKTAVALAIALSSSTAFSGPTYYLNDEAGFLAATSNLAFDSFEDLPFTGAVEPEDGLQVIDRLGYTVAVSDDTDGGLFVRSKVGDPTPGFFIGDQRVAYVSQQDRGGIAFDFGRQITAFGLYVIDAPEAPDGNGNFDLRYFDSNGRNQLVRQGPIGDETAVFFGVVYEGESIGSAFFSLPAASDGFSIDSVYVSAVPEPAGTLMLGSLLIVFSARRGWHGQSSDRRVASGRS